jgi:hypothetical protein
MATKTVIKTVKLVYEDTKKAVKPNDIVQSRELGEVIVTNVHAAKHKSSHGRLTLTLADGTKGDYSPAYIKAIWQ